MKTEIIAVGTELLLGQIANTNAQWISKQLAGLGMPVYHHQVVGDNMDRVKASFESAHQRSDVVIITGGLGPTEDDMTRDAAQSILGLHLIEDSKSMDRITSFYEKNQQHMTPNNRKQALVFEGAQVLQNDEGMAPGQIINYEGKVWVFLPGVPSEMKSLMDTSVLPYFKSTFELKSDIVSEMMHFIGIGESTLEDQLSDLITKQTNPTLAPLASEGEVGLRITATGETPEQARGNIAATKKEVLNRVGNYYYGSDDSTIEEKVRDLLKTEGLTLGAAESLTGGKFIESMISLPGASAVCQGSLVTYTSDAKQHVLGIPAHLIHSFGTISFECADEMAERAQEKLGADVALSFTGVAGPDSSEGQDPGTVFIGMKVGNQETYVENFHFDGGREKIRSRAVKKGYELLFHHLKK